MTKKYGVDPVSHKFISEYDEETRDKVVSLYLITGSLAKASKLCNVPYRTLCAWKKSNWFDDKLREAKKKYTKQLDSRFTGLLQHISKQLEDRILNGDVTVTAMGKTVRHPVRASELARIGDSVFKSLQLIRGEATSNVRSLEPEEKLEKIREKLLEKKQSKQDTDDHVVH